MEKGLLAGGCSPHTFTKELYRLVLNPLLAVLGVPFAAGAVLLSGKYCWSAGASTELDFLQNVPSSPYFSKSE